MKNALKQKAARAMWAKHPWKPPADKAHLTRLYWECGMSQHEIAAELGVTQKVVWRAMVRLEIPRRAAAVRMQQGPWNPRWKGAGAKYQAMHLRVQALKGRPKKCSVCRVTDPQKRYDWANLTGKYDDPDDYARMCRSCHRRYDHARRKAAR